MTQSVIRCCYGCQAPKRHPGCHDHCPEYQQEKQDYEKRKAELDRKKAISGGVYAERAEKVHSFSRRKSSGRNGYKGGAM